MRKVVKSITLIGFIVSLVVAGQYVMKPDIYGQSSPESETIKV
ncbi:hypothetical protein [Bacillus manliponensis]